MLMCLLLGFALAEELQLRQSSDMPSSPPMQQTEENRMGDTAKASAKVSKNLSVRADAFATDGYSELELQTDNAHKNELEALMSRYGAGVEVHYAFNPDARVKVEFFAANGLEINFQRRGGKVKAYDTVSTYEENAYNYGSKVSYSGFTSSMGAAVTILKSHRVMFTWKQTQYSYNDALLAMSASEGKAPIAPMGGVPVTGNLASNTALSAAPSTVTSQVFLTYSYIF